MNHPICLMTPTWSADRVHFDLMRASVERSALNEIPHHVIVQSEDIDAFQPYQNSPSVRLTTTAEQLPAEVERMRQRARQLRQWLGRDLTRILSSTARRAGWPRWVHYTGWHTQQIVKLAVVAASDIDNVVVLDSDVVVTPHARVDDFLHRDRIVCFERLAPLAEANRKVLNWNRQAQALWHQTPADNSTVDIHFDTPFVFHAPSVRRMLAELETLYERPWWQVLLNQPPRRWSEFATYRTYLRLHAEPDTVDWQNDRLVRYLFDASDPQAVARTFRQLLQDPDSHYITIHSQSSGRQLWGAEAFAPLILPLLDNPDSI